jgi:hypothetical protein
VCPVNPHEADRDLAAAERIHLKREYSAAFADISTYFYKVHPMGLNLSVNPDEYEPEVGTILPRILDAESAADIARVVRDEFERWFGPRLKIEPAVYDDLTEGVLGDLDAVPVTRC